MTIATLIALFEEDIGTAHTLLELINQELLALTATDLPTLQNLLNQKQPLLALLAQHAQARSQLLTNENLSADRAGLDALAAHSNDGAQLQEKASQLASVIEQCQTANQRNGRLIRANQATMGHLVGLLRGNDTPTLYDSKGSAARIGQHRPLSQA